MKNNPEVVFTQPIETSQFIVYSQVKSSDFIQYQIVDSLIPSSLDQIMKNGLILYENLELNDL